MSVVRQKKRVTPLAGTILLAIAVVVGVSVWVLTDPKSTTADAVRTGGLAGASVVALYALWLNDRRRKVEEARQEIERGRHELESFRAERDLERVADERFAKSIELLGHEAEQVRVGAMHALAGLARGRPEYTQTVLDIVCSYLRRPFDLEDGAPSERVVRLNAQQVLTGLLPDRDATESYDLDLTGAALSRFDLSGKRIGELTLREATLGRSTILESAHITGSCWLTRATLQGPLEMAGARVDGRAWFSGTTLKQAADLERVTFGGDVAFSATFQATMSLRDARFEAALDLRNATFRHHADLRVAGEPSEVRFGDTRVGTGKDVQLPEGWTLEEERDGGFVIERG
ncbi:pentapeptide repeat-containing protein [Amycolatopsis suaedae]|uniref:Pentapeptide repeat-containing protein n=1 Tax=Amycolatopsis suaedae TaxID=2510978 RepID=A0A4Q7JDX1_9PSEU|nr:pentapeptide repeat-containing protein [Amycolatopsis suaedae]RZQ65282.1 hypothetical protein EWH70_05210 [Amycolatopsis suaedae]